MSSLKQEFLKKWIEGLKRCRSSKKNMSILERKKAIKLSADVAMASARNGTTCWSRALIASASKDGVEQILGTPESPERMKMKKVIFPTSGAALATFCNNKRRMTRFRRSKKILKRSSGIRRRRNIAERLVRKRTQVLKSLIPGGESMNDEVSLMEETLDYIISLSAQVDVMRSLASVSELVNRN